MATADELYLRQLLADRKPATGGATFFSDEDITAMLARNASTRGAAAEGWAIRAAEYAGLIDMDEAGSARKLSQRYSQALRMSNFYLALAAEEFGSSTETVRTIAVVADILGMNELDTYLVNEYRGEQSDPTEHLYPTHRMPAVLS